MSLCRQNARKLDKRFCSVAVQIKYEDKSARPNHVRAHTALLTDTADTPGTAKSRRETMLGVARVVAREHLVRAPATRRAHTATPQIRACDITYTPTNDVNTKTRSGDACTSRAAIIESAL